MSTPSPSDVRDYLLQLLDRWEEVRLSFDGGPAATLAEIEDQRVLAYLIVKLLIGEYRLDEMEDQ